MRKNTCPRVEARIECPQCAYPCSEALFTLNDLKRWGSKDPGHVDQTTELNSIYKGGGCE